VDKTKYFLFAYSSSQLWGVSYGFFHLSPGHFALPRFWLCDCQLTVAEEGPISAPSPSNAHPFFPWSCAAKQTASMFPPLRFPPTEQLFLSPLHAKRRAYPRAFPSPPRCGAFSLKRETFLFPPFHPGVCVPSPLTGSCSRLFPQELAFLSFPPALLCPLHEAGVSTSTFFSRLNVFWQCTSFTNRNMPPHRIIGRLSQNLSPPPPAPHASRVCESCRRVFFFFPCFPFLDGPPHFSAAFVEARFPNSPLPFQWR